MRDRSGENNGRAKLSWRAVAELRRAHEAGISLRVLAKRFGVSVSTVHSAVHEVTWRQAK